MKVNEAPEKIYMTPSFGEPDNVLLASFSKSHLNFYRDIEYTRTDAFIEKAEEYMYKQLNEGCIECGDIKRFVEDFEEYLKK